MNSIFAEAAAAGITVGVAFALMLVGAAAFLAILHKSGFL